MFVRKKKNRSGSTSVVVVTKKNGVYKEIKSFGVSHSALETEKLEKEAKEWILNYGNQTIIDFDLPSNQTSLNLFFDNITSASINGTQLLFNKIYDDIGFNAIQEPILKQLVFARISEPNSKLATSEYLKSHYNEDYSQWQIYRYLDKLNSKQKEEIQKISIEHTIKILGGYINVLFYDVTTLYFETNQRDDLRQSGFSKDGKTSEAQIVLGLLVSAGGYPLSYSIFSGSQYEGRTMMPIIDDFKQRFDIKDFVVVADSGLMNHKNIDFLNSSGYKYIIGARIKNENEDIKNWILSLPKQESVFHEYKKDEDTRLIIGYSQKRANNDAYNRNRGVKRLQRDYAKGTITKAKINKQGYNKFLELSNDVEVTINYDKIQEDASWDGLKGYITNTKLSASEVIEQYHGLWVVERAFRVTKGNLEMRPIYHFTEKRIEAHICICFVAYKIYKELERILKIKQIDLSVDKVIKIAKTIITLQIKHPITGEIHNKTLFLTPEHKSIQSLFNF